jgi:hypothetical protein
MKYKKTKATHTMEYGSGGGTWYDGGDWQLQVY